jgi:hypothetical protein
MTACTGQPVSWLLLERFHLGELQGDARAQVAAHLDECDACRACAESIRAQDALPLRPLPAAALTPRARPLAAAAAWLRRHWTAPALAAAAVAVALVIPGRGPRIAAFPPPRVALKGGELALSLARDRAGQISLAPTTFAAGDRFKALVTCPPPGAPFVEVAVFQGGQASFPLPSAQPIRCGNQVPLGAFALDGGAPVAVCVVLAESDATGLRASLAGGLPPALRERTACVELAPSR